MFDIRNSRGVIRVVSGLSGYISGAGGRGAPIEFYLVDDEINLFC